MKNIILINEIKKITKKSKTVHWLQSTRLSMMKHNLIKNKKKINIDPIYENFVNISFQKKSESAKQLRFFFRDRKQLLIHDFVYVLSSK